MTASAMETGAIHDIQLRKWQHVFKLDPDKVLNDQELEAVCMSGTDAIMIGGSSGITYDNTVDLMSRVRRYALPVVQEVSVLDAVVPGFDAYMIPMVLNSTSTEWLVGQHMRAIAQYGYMIPWELLIPEGYIILNPEATAAKVSEANSELTGKEAAAYAEFADKLMHLPIIYIEYSGTYGDMKVVRQIRAAVRQGQVFYGGGIRTMEQASEAAQSADTVVVGNLIYDDLQAALSTVQAVRAVREQQPQQ